MTTALEELLRSHPGRHDTRAVALLGAGDVAVLAVGVAAEGAVPCARTRSCGSSRWIKPITAVAALRLEADSGSIRVSKSGCPSWRIAECSPAPPRRSMTPYSPNAAPTLRHLLTNSSGYGTALVSSPAAGNGRQRHRSRSRATTLSAQEWLTRLAELRSPSGEGWRYHHSFGVLGILIARLTDRPLGEHLADDLFGPLAMTDTGLWVPAEKLDRLPAAYRHSDDGLVEIEAAGGGFTQDKHPRCEPRRARLHGATSTASPRCWRPGAGSTRSR